MSVPCLRIEDSKFTYGLWAVDNEDIDTIIRGLA